ncbi:unnamed protein product, partial [Closterium sp. NIES-54]
LHKSRIAIFDLDFDAILSAMYALSVSVEGDCYLCVPPDPGIAAATLGASESGTLPGTVPAEALHTFTLDSGASRCFFRDSTTLTPLAAPVPVRLADPSGGPVVARSSTVLPCPAVFVSGEVAASCSCRLLSHQTLLWHHRLGHPSLPHLRGMHSRLLRAAPHSSSFPPRTAPLQTLHMDVWGPVRVSGQSREHYFLLVVDDYTRYTTVFPLCRKGQVVDVLIPWIRTVHLQLRECFGQDLPVLRLQSDKGGEFSSNLLREFCRGEGIFHHGGRSYLHDPCGYSPFSVAVCGPVRCASAQPLAPCLLAETSPTLRRTGEIGDTSADKLSPCAIPCVFLGFVPDALGWQFYHPTSRRVLSSQDVTFNESVPFYRLFPYRSTPPPPPPLFLAPGPPP